MRSLSRQLVAALRASLVPLVLLAPSWARAQSAPASAARAHSGTSGATRAPITVDDLRRRVGIIADDSTMGRATGSRGDDAAARYVAAEFRRLGLVPLGEHGSYFQEVPLLSRRFDPAVVELRVGADALARGRDYLPYAPAARALWTQPRRLHSAEVVFGGRMGDTARLIDSATAAGRFVLLLPPNTGSRAGFALRDGVPARLRGAAGVALVALDQTPANFRALIEGETVALVEPRRTEPEGPAVFLLSARAAWRLLGASADSVPVGTRGARVDGQTGVIEGPLAVPARNVIAVLPGSDPTLRATYVAISAHHDHVGFNQTPVDHDSLRAYMREYERLRQASPLLSVTPAQAAAIHVDVAALRRVGPVRPDSIFNGADDDASGTAALLEIAERFASNRVRPKRSILFLSHTGEELGLLGSRWHSDHPLVPRDSIIAELDMDMVGRGAATDLVGGGPDYLELIGTRRQSTEFGDLIDTLNTHRVRPFQINYAYDAPDHPEGDWCRADHYSYARHGIPVAAFSTSYHGDYHQVTDEAQYLDYPHLAAVAGFVRDIVDSLANRARRPVLDHPQPAGPNARCVQ